MLANAQKDSTELIGFKGANLVIKMGYNVKTTLLLSSLVFGGNGKTKHTKYFMKTL